jgi:hypothetical protein
MVGCDAGMSIVAASTHMCSRIDVFYGARLVYSLINRIVRLPLRSGTHTHFGAGRAG